MQQASGQARGPALEVQVFGLDNDNAAFSQRATVLDFDDMEVVLADVRANLRPENVVGVRYGERKVRFRVTWIGRPGSNQAGQVRLRTIEPMRNLWGDILAIERPPRSALDASLPGSQPKWRGHNRRSHERIACNGKVQYHLAGVHTSAWATLKDISRGGCYLETAATMPTSSEIDLDLTVDGLHLRTFGVVQACNPGYGMGIAFQEMKDVYRDLLDQWIVRHSTARQAFP